MGQAWHTSLLKASAATSIRAMPDQRGVIHPLAAAVLDHSTVRQDDFSSNRHPALSLCLSMSFFAKPVPTFAGHALAPCLSVIFFRKPVPTLGSNPRAGFFRDHALGAADGADNG